VAAKRGQSGLFRVDLDDPDLRIGPIPIRRGGVEDETKVAFVARGERRRRDGLGIYVGIAGTDQLERLGIIAGHFPGYIVEEHLDGDARDRAAALVGDLAVHVGNLAPGQIARLAHGETRDWQVGGIRICRCRDRRDGRGLVSALHRKDDGDSYQNDNAGSDHQRHPVAFFSLFFARDELKIVP
jgi:hypothetical protein